MITVAIAICETDHWHGSPSPPHSNNSHFMPPGKKKSENKTTGKVKVRWRATVVTLE